MFYSFWFRFIFKYSYIIEIENYAKLQEIIGRDYSTFSGLMLERYFHRVAMESGEFTRIGRWWNRRWKNEINCVDFRRDSAKRASTMALAAPKIDMIAEDELSDKVTFCEIKRQADEISIGVLKQRAEVMLQATHEFKKYDISYKGLSMEDM